MKRCEDCRHSVMLPSYRTLTCGNILRKWLFTVSERDDVGGCGPDAVYFEATWWSRVKGFFKWKK